MATAKQSPVDILIAEDSPTQAEQLRLLLETEGHHVRVAMHGRLAFAAALARKPDVLITDVVMPEMDGYELCKAIKCSEKLRDVPVILVTSLTSMHEIAKGLACGADNFIRKPYDPDALLDRIDYLLRNRDLRRQSKIQDGLEIDLGGERHLIFSGKEQILDLLVSTFDEAIQANEKIRRQRDELQALYDKVVTEQKVSERLLLNLLPSPIAERLKARADLVAGNLPEIIADKFQQATVLFADIVQFTRFSASMSPETLIAVLNEIFTTFDSIADERGLEKIKTIGDAYMAAAGLPVPRADHAARAAHMALDMMDAVARFNARTGYKLQLRIGLNSGAVVAGVIGKRKFIYDLWGDAVNVASRMESQGVAGRVQVTEATRWLLGNAFQFEERGTIPAKGTGMLHTWFLLGRVGSLPESGAARGSVAPRRGNAGGVSPVG